MIRIELLPKTAQTHAQMLRRAIVHLEENRRLAASSTAGAIAEIQQSLREVAELLEGRAEVERLDETLAIYNCIDCGRALGSGEGWIDIRRGQTVRICRDLVRCREMQRAR